MRLHAPIFSARLAATILLSSGFTWLALASNPAPRHAGNAYYVHHDHIIGTSLDVWLTAPDEAAADAAEHAILAEIERLRRVFSLYDPDSELSRLNRTREPMSVSADMIEVMRQYEVWQQRSHGAFSG